MLLSVQPAMDSHAQPRTLLDVLPANKQDEDRPVYTFWERSGRGRVLTFANVDRGSRGVAAYLRASGVVQGEVVAIFEPASEEGILAFWGAVRLGAVPCFMPCPSTKQDKACYWKAHETLFKRIGSGVVMARESMLMEIAVNAPDHPLRLLGLPVELCADDGHKDCVRTPADVAFLQHSSGTTSLKKGVMLSHEAVLKQVAAYESLLALKRDDVIVSWLPLYHDMGLLTSFVMPLVTRTPVVLIDPFVWVSMPQILFAAISAERGTLCWQPNFAFNHLCRTVRAGGSYDLSSMRAWINCSEPCSAKSFDRFVGAFGSLGVTPASMQVCYAMAETVFAVTQTRLGQPVRVLEVDEPSLVSEGVIRPTRAGSRGKRCLGNGVPLQGLDVDVVDMHRRSLGEGHVGEIRIRGDFLFSGYHNLPELSASKLVGGWYHSGDLGFLLGGELFVLGRKDDLILVHGKNIYAHELEHALAGVPGIHPGRCVALGWYRDEIGSHDIVVLAEAEDGVDVQVEDLAAKAKDTVLQHVGVSAFDALIVPRGWLVKTTSGKISRAANLTKYLAHVGLGQSAIS